MNIGKAFEYVRLIDVSAQFSSIQNANIPILISCDILISSILVTFHEGVHGPVMYSGGTACCKPIDPSRGLRIYKPVWRPTNECQDSSRSPCITVCLNNDSIQFRSVTSEVAQSPPRTGIFPSMLPKQAFRVPTAADYSTELDFSYAFSFDALQAALGYNN